MTKKYVLGALNISILLVLTILVSIGIITIKFLPTNKSIFIISSLFILLLIIISLYFSKDYRKYNIGVFISLILNIFITI